LILPNPLILRLTSVHSGTSSREAVRAALDEPLGLRVGPSRGDRRAARTHDVMPLTARPWEELRVQLATYAAAIRSVHKLLSPPVG
jgi:hypothetical protein